LILDLPSGQLVGLPSNLFVSLSTCAADSEKKLNGMPVL